MDGCGGLADSAFLLVACEACRTGETWHSLKVVDPFLFLRGYIMLVADAADVQDS